MADKDKDKDKFAWLVLVGAWLNYIVSVILFSSLADFFPSYIEELCSDSLLPSWAHPIVMFILWPYFFAWTLILLPIYVIIFVIEILAADLLEVAGIMPMSESYRNESLKVKISVILFSIGIMIYQWVFFLGPLWIKSKLAKRKAD